MSGPPTGTVTFLFTDIEGSTRMWERDPVAMRSALSRHDEILNEAIERHGGYVFKTVGDAFCAAFPTSPRPPMRWRPPSRASALFVPKNGRRAARSGRGWRSTPARPRSGMATTSALR